MILIKDAKLSVWFDSWCSGKRILKKSVRAETIVSHLRDATILNATLEGNAASGVFPVIQCLTDAEGRIIHRDGTPVKSNEYEWTSEDRRKMIRLECENAELKLINMRLTNTIDRDRVHRGIKDRIVKSFKILLGLE